MQPFIKWAGGKTQLLDKILPLVPGSIDTYVEPFVGGGAVLSRVLENPDIKNVYINDINFILIAAYRIIKADVNGLMTELDKYMSEFNSYETDDARKKMYNRVRAQFNILNINKVASVESTAMFIFLNKTGFNGLYRINKLGKFNVPFGYKKHISLYDRQNLLDWHGALQKCIIYNESYEHIKPDIDYSKSFWYLDPPYKPVTKTSFVSYTENRFYDADQESLKKYLDDLNSKGAKVLESNSDCEYFDELYAGYTITRVPARRSINSNGAGRGPVNEILIRNY